jgi:hypothetical protein
MTKASMQRAHGKENLAWVAGAIGIAGVESLNPRGGIVFFRFTFYASSVA